MPVEEEEASSMSQSGGAAAESTASKHTSTSRALSGAAQALLAISARAEGLSGRALRKLPFLAHALYATSECPVPPRTCQAC